MGLIGAGMGHSVSAFGAVGSPHAARQARRLNKSFRRGTGIVDEMVANDAFWNSCRTSGEK
jgi:hypothetical protein